MPCVRVSAGWCASVCTRGALIPASLSNYLNCAYRSYCTARFPSVSYTLPSCLPAALAVEISTLGNFVLHNNYCTWGMFLSKEKKKSLDRKKNSFLAQPHTPYSVPSARTGRDEFLNREALVFGARPPLNRWLLCALTIISRWTVHPFREIVSLGFLANQKVRLLHVAQNNGVSKEYYGIFRGDVWRRALFSIIQPFLHTRPCTSADLRLKHSNPPPGRCSQSDHDATVVPQSELERFRRDEVQSSFKARTQAHCSKITHVYPGCFNSFILLAKQTTTTNTGGGGSTANKAI